MLELHEVHRALVITAHPDDVDFGAAGSVANMTDAGIEVTYCTATRAFGGGLPSRRHAVLRRCRVDSRDSWINPETRR